MNCARRISTHRCPALIPALGPGFIRSTRQYWTDPVLLMQSSGLFNQRQLITNVRSQFNKQNLAERVLHVWPRQQQHRRRRVRCPPILTACRANTGLPRSTIATACSSAEPSPRRGTCCCLPSSMPIPARHSTSSPAPIPYGDHAVHTARPGIVRPNPPRSHFFDGWASDLNPNPTPGEAILPRNFGRSPGSVSLNFRFAKTFGFGGSRESTSRPRNNGGDFGGGWRRRTRRSWWRRTGRWLRWRPGGGPGGFFRGLGGGPIPARRTI